MLVHRLPLVRAMLFPGASAVQGRGAGRDAPSTPCDPGGFEFPPLQSIIPGLAADLSPALLSAASEAGGVREAED